MRPKIIQFQYLPDGAFFRRPGFAEIYRKIALRYESTREVNMQSKNGNFHLANWDVLCVPVEEDSVIPTKEELENELPRPKQE